MRTLILVRHGQYKTKDWKTLAPNFGLNQLLQATDNRLTPRGIEQAKCTGQRLEGLPINKIFCSSLIRTQETAQIIGSYFPKIEIEASEMLWECLPTMPQKPTENVAHLSETEITKSRNRANSVYNRWFQPTQQEDSTELIICHGNLICYLAAKTLGLPIHGWTQLEAMNCAITKISIETDKKYVTSLNDTNHLSDGLETSG